MYDKGKGDWYVKDGGNSRASKRGFDTQKEAEDWGRSHSQKRKIGTADPPKRQQPNPKG